MNLRALGGEENVGDYYKEVEAFAKEHLGVGLYEFPFRWEDYDAFKAHIEDAFAKYQAKH